MKVIDRLKTIRDGYVAIHKPLKFVDIQHLVEPPTTIDQYKYPKYLTTATLEFSQIGTDESITEEILIRERAAKVIAFELYGEVIDRIRDILHYLYKEGPRYDDNVVKDLEKLISDLQLKDRTY